MCRDMPCVKSASTGVNRASETDIGREYLRKVKKKKWFDKVSFLVITLTFCGK